MLTRSLAALIMVLGIWVQHSHGTIVLTPEVSITAVGDTSANVVIRFRALTDPLAPVNPPAPSLGPPPTPSGFEQVGYYHFQATLTGASINSLTATYDSTLGSVWSNLDRVDLNGVLFGTNPGVSGSTITFKAGGALGGVGTDPYNIEPPTSGDHFIGSISFTATLNGAFTVTTSPLSTSIGGGDVHQNTLTAFNGFAQDQSSGATQVNGSFGSANFNVTNISAVPEPSSLLLIGGALACSCSARFRRTFHRKAAKS